SLGLPLEIADRLASFSPYVSMLALVSNGEAIAALPTVAFWLSCGLAGAAVAAWRLRPSCLAAAAPVNKTRRRGWVPPLGERPMLWKELFIERAGSLGRFGRWLGVLITASVFLGSLVPALIIVWAWITGSESGWALWAHGFLGDLLGESSGRMFGWL